MNEWVYHLIKKKPKKTPKTYSQNVERGKDSINDPGIIFHFYETSPNNALRYNEILR